MARRNTGLNVFDEAIERMVNVMEDGNRVVVSFSAGKDSCVTLEVTLIAAQMTGYGPVDVVIRDEEILFPGSYEYADRIAQRHGEIIFHHFIAKQPIINAFNRLSPYWWVFDDQLPPEAWVRLPPHWNDAGRPELVDNLSYKPASWTEGSQVVVIPEKHIEAMVTKERFPTPEGKDLYDVIGLRVSESRGRLFGIFSSGGYITKPRPNGVRKCRPVYDWADADVWKAVLDNRWDYNNAYDVLYRLGAPRMDLRIAPPTMNAAGTRVLARAAAAWPRWFDRVQDRCPGVKTAAQFGLRSVSAQRRRGETWEECFQRECIDTAPDWIRERAETVRTKILNAHHRHSTAGLPEVNACWQCAGDVGSWKNMNTYLYLGDPFAIKTGSMLKAVEPEFFRPGAGVWGGVPAYV